MKSSKRSEKSNLKSVYGNENGVILSVTLMFMAILAAMGSVTVVMTRADIKVSDNYKNNEQAFFVAQAGAEHAREQLRAINAASANKSSFSDELAAAAGGNGMLDGYVAGTDDLPLISAGTLAGGSYQVYLANDTTDGLYNVTDTNKTVMLTSVAAGPNGSQAVIEMTVTTFDLFTPPAPITLVGPGANFIGNQSNAKDLHGDDQCATDPIGVTRPVVAVSHLADKPNIQAAIAGSKPDTYFARNSTGGQVTASTDPDAISTTISGSTLSDIQANYGVNLLSAQDLNQVVKGIEKAADTVAPGGTSSSAVYVGAPGDTQVVMVKGDFALNHDGAGILVVTGTLTYKGNITYDGIVFVIGQGAMVRNGAGTGNIRGGILVARTVGPDNIMYTADDVLGTPLFDTSGGGTANVSYCSTAMEQAITDIPPRAIAFNHLM
ncbi:MAG TPA: pilus assembly PilX N-terminal domain-containing protein [Candidatus Binatia bacterium]